MEALVALAVLAGALLLALLAGRSSRSSKQSTPAAPPQPSAGAATGQSSRFDADSARHLHRTRTLTGPAWVVDGDTIKIKNTQIRLFGIDAPGLNHPYGKQTKWALHKLCKGHAVRAEITEEDHYGRTVARCYLSDGSDLSVKW